MASKRSRETDRFTFDVEVEKGWLRITVPCLDNYPNKEYKRHHLFIAVLSLNFDKDADKVRLNEFYVYPSNSVYTTSEEKRLVKGLGKKMICHAIRILIVKRSITPDAILTLEASGGEAEEKVTKDIMEKYTETELDKILSEFPDTIRDLEYDSKLEGRKITFNDKATLYCAYLQNQKLVDYYKTYGLQVEDDTDMSYTKMSGKVSDIIRTCKESKCYGRRLSKRLKLNTVRS